MPVRRPPEESALFATPLRGIADLIAKRLRKRGARLTLGGEPTLVPIHPDGSEWSFVAVGPTKLSYAYKLADRIIERFMPGAITVYSPGKVYPGEVNPRWVVNILGNRDGSPITPALPEQSGTTKGKGTPVPRRAMEALQLALARALRISAAGWIQADDPVHTGGRVAVLPLDHDGKRWKTERWKMPGRRRTLPLLSSEGPAGLRLPLNQLPPEALRRALTLEWRENALHLFLPPLLQEPFRHLLDLLAGGLLAEHGFNKYFFEGYVPQDEAGSWTRVGLTADPGVLEINVPPCETWFDYHRWLVILEEAGRESDLRSWKQTAQGGEAGTGGGNHLLFGGPSLEENPFFTRPAWVASLLRYFQAHPCLAYFFTGVYVGASSQAPRPDESARDLYDLELAYQYLAGLPADEDNRYFIGETLRHLHTDITGNTHRSEISFDKFWNTGGPSGGTAGLIEFRAIESLPHASWMSLVALLWQAIAAHTLDHPSSAMLTAKGPELHDRFFLPTPLWDDLRAILADLRNDGMDLPEEGFRKIWEWRFPLLLTAGMEKGANLEVRRACESWPLLCETPSEGGSTSRFVDTSIDRLEFAASAGFARRHRVFVNGRELRLMPVDRSAPAASRVGVCGLRYRRTALYPSLHPGIKPHLPLEISITGRDGRKHLAIYRLTEQSTDFQAISDGEAQYPLELERPAIRSGPTLLTYDLRLG